MDYYTKEEMIGITELGKSLGSYLDKIKSKMYQKIAIIRRNKPEAVILPIEEYEMLKKAYDLLEQKEIEELLEEMNEDDKKIAKTKSVEIDTYKNLKR